MLKRFICKVRGHDKKLMIESVVANDRGGFRVAQSQEFCNRCGEPLGPWKKVR